jgi:iron complex transport system permease protein
MDDAVLEKADAAIPSSYRQHTRRKKLILLGLVLLTLALAVIAVNAGADQINPLRVFRAVFGLETGPTDIVIWNIRLPRVAAGLLAGAGLSVAGCVMQTCLRNSLASPSTLGISNAAAFGANLAIVFFGAGSIQSNASDAVIVSNPYSITVSAFAFSAVAMLLILLLARFRSFSPESMVLAGVAFGSLFSAGSTLIQYFAQDVQVAAMVYWTFGDLGRVSWKEVCILAVLIIAALLYFMFRRWDYNALESGEDAAKSLGVNVGRVRFGGMLIASLITAVAVSFMGIIGFIGLIGPQIMRRVVGNDHRFLIPASALTGAALLLLSDTLARMLISPVVLPVGAITSFFGAPLFLFLLARGYRRR